MPSRHNFHSVKVEAREGHMLEEEEEAHIEVEEAALQAQVEETAIKIQVKTKVKVKHKVKAKLVVKGYKQHHGRDYAETFVPVARMETVRIVVEVSTQHKWKVYQMDIKSGFLNGFLKAEVYVVQPPGYDVGGQEDKEYRLRKALYGLKQAPRAWYSRIDAYLLDNGFSKCDDEPTLYIKESVGKIHIVVLYVDDLIFTSIDDFLIADFKEVMKSEFEMTNLGFLRYFLGIEVKQTENGIFVSQEKHVVDILERFNIQNKKPVPTPIVMGLNLSKEDCSSNVKLTLYKSMIGNLMYLTATRPDIMYEVSLVSRFMETPKEKHWKATKIILRYVNGTKEYDIFYIGTNDFRLVGYTDNDWVGSVDDRKSTLEYVLHLGYGSISWTSKKQPIVSLSKT
eukprot:PITA_07829